METKANSEMRAAWNAESGDNWVKLQTQFDRMLAVWAQLLAATVEIAPGERVLDIGCGCGATTREAATAAGPTGLAVGVDLSEQMLARGRELAEAEGVDNLRFVAGDCQVDELATDGLYDAAVSRFGVMFFEDPAAAFTNIGRALRPGGRLAFVSWAPMGQQGWLVVPAAAALAHVPLPSFGADGGPGMFSLADPAAVTDLLHKAGWRDVEIVSHERPVLVAGGGSIDQAVDFLLSTGPGRAMMAEASPEAAELATAAIRDALAEHATAAGVTLSGVAQLVTARR